MLIWFVVGMIILFLLVSNHFRKYKEADEKSLRPMSEWAILANSSFPKDKERMAYSLIIQAGSILEKMDVIKLKELRAPMLVPNFTNSNFILFVISLAPNIIPESNKESLKDSFYNQQARVYLANCIEVVLKFGESGVLDRIIAESCTPAREW